MIWFFALDGPMQRGKRAWKKRQVCAVAPLGSIRT
jgi:hypothetical protein